jgi:hypothetical protein
LFTPNARCATQSRSRTRATITFSVTGTIFLAQGELLIDKDLTINGAGAAGFEWTGWGARASSIAAGATVSISGLTCRADVPSRPFGAGIRNFGTLTSPNTVISGNAVHRRRWRDPQSGGVLPSSGAPSPVTCWERRRHHEHNGASRHEQHCVGNFGGVGRDQNIGSMTINSTIANSVGSQGGRAVAS